MGGAPENDEGIGAFITNCGLIEKEFGGLVIAVHHTGKDPEKGLRGHSSLHGATDCEWFFSETDKGRSIQLAKFKDADDELAWEFTLEQIEIGRNRYDEPMTTCIVDITSEPSKAENTKASGKAKKQLKGQKAEFLKAVKWAISEMGEIMPGVGCQPLNTKGVRRDDLKRYALQKGFFDNCKPEAQRASLNKMIREIAGDGFLNQDKEWVWLP